MTKRTLMWLSLMFGLLASSLVGSGVADESSEKCRACDAECPACKGAECKAGGTLSTLLQLRQLFGDPLAGTSLAGSDCCDEDGFATALSEVAATPDTEQAVGQCQVDQSPGGKALIELAFEMVGKAPPAQVPLPPAAPPVAFTAPSQVYSNPYTPPPLPVPHVVEWNATPAYRHAAVHVSAVSPVQALRVSARQLESVASDLEDIGQYHEADELRTVVARLRQQARDASAVAVHPTVPMQY